MISAILVYGRRGEILVSRIYKDGLRRAVTDAFRVQVIANEEQQSPLLTIGSTSFLHIRYNSLYVVAVSRHDVDGIAIFELLYKFCDLCNKLFGRFDEAACYRHISHIYEVLDEILEFGYPQNTEVGLLKLSNSLAESNPTLDHGNAQSSSSVGGSGITGAVSSLRRTLTSAKSPHSSSLHLPTGPAASSKDTTLDVPWRRSDVKHRRNEIYLDVSEKLNTVFDPDGRLLSASVDGVLKVRARLSGLPQCQVDLDHVSVLENSQLHACVNHTRFHEEGKVQFVPPEGEFDLLRYHVSQEVAVPFKIYNSEHGGELVVKVKCTLEPKRHLTNLAVNIPLPPTSTSNSFKLKSSSGKAKFIGERMAIEWKVARLTGQNEATLRISSEHHRQGPISGNGPIMVKFLINMYACSALHVQSLQVIEDAKYNTLKWVRYFTESGACEARTFDKKAHIS